MLSGLVAEFQRRFGRAPELAVRAPGRVNLIGEHTDYNGGLVLPGAIDRDTVVVAARAGGTRVRAFSRELERAGAFDAGGPRRSGDWIDYVAGPVFALRQRGVELGGIDLGIASRVPRESGLSSSAALSVAVATALDRAFGLGLAPVERARVAHAGESDFVGVPCGIMDPYASALGRADHVLRIDCRSEAVTPVALPPGRVRIVVFDSGVRRALAAGGYAERRKECEAALAGAREARIGGAGLRALSDLGPRDLPALERALPSVLFRRARHVITENERVDRVCAAFHAGDLTAAGAALRAGMRSLRDDFEVSTPEIDALCALADAQPGVYGSRLTGAGFGGCTVHLLEPAAVEPAIAAVREGFASRFGRVPPALATVLADGAGDLAL